MFSAQYNLFRLLSGLLLGVVLLSPLDSRGEEQSASAKPSTDQQPQMDFLSPVDAPRDYLSSKIVGFARYLDNFFGGGRNFQEANESLIQFSLARSMGQLGNNKYTLSGRAKLDLPSTEKRLHLLFETDPDKNVTGADTPGKQTAATTGTTTVPASGTATGTTSPESYAAALRYEESREKRDRHFSADAGLRFAGAAPRPFARLRGSYSVPLEQWRLKAAETVFWFNTIGTGETTQIDLERFVSDPMLFRATSSATWLKHTLNFDLRQDFSLYQTVDERNALLYQAGVVGVTHPVTQVTDSFLLLLYRHRLHRSWMFIELSPQLHFPKERNYHLSTLFTVRLEVNFDASR